MLGGAIAYLSWMAGFLLLRGFDAPVVETIFWLAAPVITAAGFAAGATAKEPREGDKGTKFLQVLPWSLIGCVVGAGAVYSFGPMLIVFGMLSVGTASIILRELLLHFKVPSDAEKQ
jgi:hypothetical protein